MVRRFFPGAHVAVDADIDQPVAGLRRHQEVVDPKAPVLLPGPGLVVPEGVLPGLVGHRSQRVGQPEAQQGLKGLAGGRAEQGVIDPGRGVVDVPGVRNDVEVACEDQWLLGFKSFPRILKKPRHPIEFVGIFIGIRRVSIGQIKTRDPHHAVLQGDDTLEEAGVGVLVVAGESRLGFVERQLRQQRYTVEGFLSVGDDVVAERLDSSSLGKASSVHLISCRQTMSGEHSFSQVRRCSSRCRIELTFHVAMRMRGTWIVTTHFQRMAYHVSRGL